MFFSLLVVEEAFSARLQIRKDQKKSWNLNQFSCLLVVVVEIDCLHLVDIVGCLADWKELKRQNDLLS